MSGPLPLRLCCIAAMAPALTEAATQAKIKLESSTAASSDSVNRRNNCLDKEGKLDISSENLIKIVKPCDQKPISLLNGEVRKQTSLLSKLQPSLPTTFKVSIKDPRLLNQGFQSEFLKTLTGIRVIGKASQIMNQPSQKRDNNEEDKCRGSIAQNGSHRPVQGDNGKNAGGTASRQLQQQQQRQAPTVSGQAAAPLKPPQSMCKKTEMTKPATNSPVSTPGTSQAGRQVTFTLSAAQMHSVLNASPDVDDKVDEDVQNARVEASKKQAQLERRIEFLQRRLRRVMSRQVEQHTRQQLVNFVDYQHQNMQSVPRPAGSATFKVGTEMPKQLLTDDCKSLSTAALVSLVQRMQQKSATLQPLVTPPLVIKSEMASVLSMTDEVRRESKATAEKLRLSLHSTHLVLDSDATESSSGGESCEEDVEGMPVPTTPLIRRAEWKYAYERAQVASRWTWLQAQVSDLEYRIRQQSDIYKQARTSKGLVILGEPPPPQDFLPRTTASSQGAGRTSGVAVTVTGTEVSPCNVNALLSNVDKQASRLTQSLGNCLSPANSSPGSSIGSYSRHKSGVSSPIPVPNGLIDSPLSTASVDVEGETSPPGLSSSDSRPVSEPMDMSPVLDPSCRAARCLPLKQALRKRKLLRTAGLHQRSAKAAKLSTVQCRCNSYPVMMNPCVLCSGRSNCIQTIDPYSMPVPERVALLDHSYHQVLSFQEEVPLSIHLEALLRSGEPQNKMAAGKSRSDASGSRRGKYAQGGADGRKVPKKQYKKNAVSVMLQKSNKIRNKYTDQKVGRKAGGSGKRGGKQAVHPDLKRRKNGMKKRKNSKNVDLMGSQFDTPAASPLSRDASGLVKEKEVRKRRGESAYDINNIVIPHNMASLTRLEKLEYKEIPIPSWRELQPGVTPPTEEPAPSPVKVELPDHKSNGLIDPLALQEDENEDLSDEVFITRHNRCEAEEKKRFNNFVMYPPTRRNRTQSHMSSSSMMDPLHTDPGRPATPSTPFLPVSSSMGTQASLDAEFGLEDSNAEPPSYRRPSMSVSQTASAPQFHLGPLDDENSLSSSFNLSGFSGLNASGGDYSSRRGSMSLAQRDRPSLASLGSSMSLEEVDFLRPGMSKTPWEPRQFPLSDEDFEKMQEENLPPAKELNPRPARSLRPVPTLTSLKLHEEGGSQGGSSLSGSLPPSPMPSTSSISNTGDYDTADPEWVAESESAKRTLGQHKAIKR